MSNWKVRDRDVWHQVVSTAMLHWRRSPIKKKKAWQLQT